MKVIYISRPLRKNLRSSYNLIQRAIEKKIRDKNITIDPDGRHSIISYLGWTEDAVIPLSEYYMFYDRRLDSIAKADLVIFIEDWMDLIECKFDWEIMKLFKKTNHLTFKSSLDSNGEIDLKIAEGLPQKL